jgi:hypothetical protein
MISRLLTYYNNYILLSSYAFLIYLLIYLLEG